MILSTIQRLACESLWRNVQHDGNVPTPMRDVKGLPFPVAQRRIANYVVKLPYDTMSALVLPEIHRRGELEPGYLVRWGNVTQASARYDQHVADDKARGEMRMSEVTGWDKTPSTSSDADSASRPSMHHTNSGTTMKG